VLLTVLVTVGQTHTCHSLRDLSNICSSIIDNLE